MDFFFKNNNYFVLIILKVLIDTVVGYFVKKQADTCDEKQKEN